MRTKIYTKGGDKGETSLFGGPRVSKSTPQLDAYGTLDELNSNIGLTLSHMKPLLAAANHSRPDIIKALEATQNELFNMGSHLACGDQAMKNHLPKLSEDLTLLLEKQIDAMTDQLPELKEFILPGGHVSAAAMHVSRTVCRRAERLIVQYLAQNTIMNSADKNLVIIFLNRLSDYLFVAARYLNLVSKTNEVKWKKS